MESTCNHNTSEEQQDFFLNALFQAPRTVHNVEFRVISKDSIVVAQHFSRDHKKIKQIIKRYRLTHNIYFGVFTREGERGKAENVREGTCIFADMDFKNYKDGQKEADAIIKRFPIKPSLIVNSGNGYHVYWFLSKAIDVQTLKEKIINILKSIAIVLSADTSVADIARVLRMPGTLNHKSDPPKPVNIIYVNEIRYSLEDFRAYETSIQEHKKPLKKLYQGVPDGEQNVALTRLIGSLVNDGLSYEDCLEFAYQWNERNNPPETDLREIERTVKSIYEKHHRELYTDRQTNIKDDPLSFLKKGSDLINLECNVEWVIDRLIPKQSITLLHGRGGIGKTWISLISGDAISKGIPFMGLPSQQQPVVFVDFENSLPVLVERVKKIGASEVLFWHNTNEIRPPKLDRDEWEQYKSLPVGLLIFDTLRASQGRDENSSQDMALIMSRLKELRDVGFTIILLHHTPKSNDRTYKGSTAIMDLADHVLSLHKVKRGNLEDLSDDEDEAECYYRFGTKDKTRYEPFHIFLDFDPEKGFVVAPDPDEEDMKEIHTLIVELKESKGELPIQSHILDKAKEELNLGSIKTRKLLRKGEGKYWNSTHIPERKNAKVYEPISVCQFVTPIYTQQTNKLPSQVNQFVNESSKDNTTQRLDNTEFDSLSEDIKQTNKQEVIDLEHEKVEIIE